LTDELRRSSVYETGRKIARSLQEKLADPSQWQALKSAHSNLRISQFNLAWFSRLESETGLRSHNETLTYVIENSRRENLILPASLKLLFHDDRPVCLSGPSGSGKSLFLKLVLPSTPGPLFLVDLADEHKSLKRVSVGDFFEIKWAREDPGRRLKFVPSGNLDVSKGELRTIFSHLNMLKLDQHSPDRFPSGVLANWTVIIEEAHRIAREPAFQNFLAESRKFTKKILVVASDPLLYGSICRLVRPPPLQEMLEGEKLKVKILVGKFGYADDTRITVTLEGQRELRLIVKPDGETVYEEGEHIEFKFQPGKPVKLSWECSG
jgi:hypothetical protein